MCLGPGGVKNNNITVDTASFSKALKGFFNVNPENNQNERHDSESWCFGVNDAEIARGELNRFGDTEGLGENGGAVQPELYVVDPPFHTPVHAPLAFGALHRPFVRASIVKITVSHTRHPLSSDADPDPVWLQTLALNLDISSNVQTTSDIFGYFPHLTVCSVYFLMPENQTSSIFCVRADALNFLSTVNTHLHITQEELVIHMWYQVSDKGGKIKGSDVYVPVSLKLADSGLLFPKSGQLHSQALMQTPLECMVHLDQTSPGHVVIFSFSPTYRTSLQHATADFCQGYQLSHTSCYHAMHQVYKCVRESGIYTKMSEFPRIQQMPNPQNPFVFIHFEKVGGSSLRA